MVEDSKTKTASLRKFSTNRPSGKGDTFRVLNAPAQPRFRGASSICSFVVSAAFSEKSFRHKAERFDRLGQDKMRCFTGSHPQRGVERRAAEQA